MSDQLEFDPRRADSLISDLLRRKRDIERTLDQIKRLVRSRVDANWEGASREAFKDLYNESSNNIAEYLNAWIENVNRLIEETKALKDEQEQAETRRIEQARQQVTQQVYRPS